MNSLSKLFCNKYISDEKGYSIADRIDELQDLLNDTVKYPDNYIVISENRTNEIIKPLKNGTIIFDAGLLKDCIIKGDNTKLIFNTSDKIFDNVTFEGSFICDYLYPELFGAKGDGFTDDSKAILDCVNAAYQSNIHNVKLSTRTYYVGNTIYVKKDVTIEGNADTNRWNYENSGSVILANIPNGWVFDSDLYLADNHSKRIEATKNVARSEKFHSPYKSELFNSNNEPIGNDVYGGPYSVKKITFISKFSDPDTSLKSPTYGAIRAIGVTKSSYVDLTIIGFYVGMYLTEGWTIEVKRVVVEPILVGLIMTHLTGTICDNIQVKFRKIPNATATLRNIFNSFVRNSYVGGSFYSQYFGSSSIKTTSYIFNDTNAILNLCSSEDALLTCYAEGSNIVFNNIYLEHSMAGIGYSTTKDINDKTLHRYLKSVYDAYRDACIVFSLSSNVFIDKQWGALAKLPIDDDTYDLLPTNTKNNYTSLSDPLLKPDDIANKDLYYYPKVVYNKTGNDTTTPRYFYTNLLVMELPFIYRIKGEQNTSGVFEKRLGLLITNCNFDHIKPLEIK